MRRSVPSPKSSIPYLRTHLQPVPVVDKNRISRLIAELDSDDFQTRENATRELDTLEEKGLGFSRKALEAKPSTELRRRLQALVEKHSNPWRNLSPERVRSQRGLEVLELAGIREARQVLKALANPDDQSANVLATRVSASGRDVSLSIRLPRFIPRCAQAAAESGSLWAGG